MASIELRGVAKAFGPTIVLSAISLRVEDGEFVALLGPRGCGKTTLLRIVAGLEAVGAGAVHIGERDVSRLPPERRDISMMLQSYALLPHLSVQENVRFPLRMRRLGTRAEQRERVRWALDLVRLGGLAERMPRSLSGGQQQRVALARAIVSRPSALLLDEPLSNLDARLREDMQVELIEIHRMLAITTLFVTHDQEEALSLSDRVVLMRAGRIERIGTPEDIYADPGSVFASQFVGAANLVEVAIEAGPAGWVARPVAAPELALPLPAAPGSSPGRGLLLIRQEDLVLGAAAPAGEPAVAATVETRVFLGARSRFVVRLGGLRLKCLMPGHAAFRPGEQVLLSVRPDRFRILDGAAALTPP
jgi:ABC-type Fe3+/spermidine/putrescine transport system ATPase subunit